MTRIVMDLPEGITDGDIPAIRKLISDWANREILKRKEDAPLTDEEMRLVRAAAITSGSSLQRWCHAAGWDSFGNAHSALTGRRNGLRANKLRMLARKTFL